MLGAIWRPLGTLLGPSGTLWEPSWGPLGALLGPSGALLQRSGGRLRASSSNTGNNRGTGSSQLHCHQQRLPKYQTTEMPKERFLIILQGITEAPRVQAANNRVRRFQACKSHHWHKRVYASLLRKQWRHGIFRASLASTSPSEV